MGWGLQVCTRTAPVAGVGKDRRIPEAWHMPRRIKILISKKGKGKNQYLTLSLPPHTQNASVHACMQTDTCTCLKKNQ